MVVRKYFQFIEIWAPCPICEELGYEPMVNLKVDKEIINRNLSTGLYTHKYEHGPVGGEHTVAIYINKEYKLAGSKAYEGTDGVASSEFEAGTIIPIVTKEVPSMAVHLGMVSPDEFEILQVCDGNNSVDDVATILNIDKEIIEKNLEKLREKGLIDLVRKS